MPSVRTYPAAAPLLCLLGSACVILNPAHDASEAGSDSDGASTTASASASTTAGATGSGGVTDSGGATDSGGVTDSGTTTAAETTGGDATTSSGSTGDAPLCGNATLDIGEACDDGNALSDDGCLSNCRIPRSCAEILDHDGEATNGVYLVDPQGSGVPWPAACDMTLDGGGWTGFAVQDTCNGNLLATINAVDAGDAAGVDDSCRPFAENIDSGSFIYQLDVVFQPGFEEFFLRNYKIRTILDPELNFVQTSWQMAYDFPQGSISLGDAKASGPAANWVKDGGSPDPLPFDTVLPYPLLETPFALDGPTDTLRIAWAETTAAEYSEGLYPWWAGRIFVR
ncbi:MAG: fibrinogen-like YCDxxxxGGGW domain-containing protein [Nannocystaceae bacterium]